MPVSSQYLTILNEVKTAIDGLGLTFNNVAVPCRIAKIIQWLQGTSQPILPIILVAPEDRPEDAVPWTTENEVLVKYPVSIVIVAAGNRDNTANLDVWLSWREQIRRLFQWGLQPIMSSCFFAEFVGDPAILKEAALKNYDVSGMGWKFWVSESRT
jgi:hypothetical protein